MSGVIDFTRRFIPEPLTPLFHTPVYARLTPEQRLKYNQLHGLYFNEQIIFFESAMAQHILRGFIHRDLPQKLAEGLPKFISEEAEHSGMFRHLNRNCLPGIYSKSDFHFIRLPVWVSVSLREWVRHPKAFPFFLWVLLIEEERAIFCAKEFLKHADEIEPNFLAAQRRHIQDETGHIHWDEELLDWAWPRMRPLARRFNARLFSWMMGEYFTTPRRSGLHVLTKLLEEFPALRSLWPEMREQMLRLSGHREFNLLCYSRTVTPKAFARFDQWPEFRPLRKVLLGYEPPPERALQSSTIEAPLR